MAERGALEKCATLYGMEHAGVLFAFVALVGWAFGDFFIQKTARLLNSYATLFIIGSIGAVGLLPFVFRDIPTITSDQYMSLTVLSASSRIRIKNRL